VAENTRRTWGGSGEGKQSMKASGAVTRSRSSMTTTTGAASARRRWKRVHRAGRVRGDWGGIKGEDVSGSSWEQRRERIVSMGALA